MPLSELALSAVTRRKAVVAGPIAWKNPLNSFLRPVAGRASRRAESPRGRSQGWLRILIRVQQADQDGAVRLSQPSARLIQLATAAVGVFSVVFPLLRLDSIVNQSAPYEGAGHAASAAIALACILPVLVWLTVSATHRPGRTIELAALFGLLAVVFAMMPVVGPGWVGMLYVPSALVLVLMPAPWSLALFVAIVAAEFPLTIALGLPTYRTYFVVGTLTFGVLLAAGILAIRTARRLLEARQKLTELAVVRERARLDTELRDKLESRLASIASGADHAVQMSSATEDEAISQVRAVVAIARETLAEARRMVTRFRDASIRAELETTITLLTAAGISTRLNLPADWQSRDFDEDQRAELRVAVAELLRADGRHEFEVALAPRGNRLRIEVRSLSDLPKGGGRPNELQS